MITAALIVLTLIYAFFEKPDLFQRPVSSGKIVLIILLIITSLISYLKEHSSDVQHDKAEKTIDSLQGEERALIMQIDTLRKDGKTAQRDLLQQLSDYHKYTEDLLAQHGWEVNNLTHTLGAKEMPPTLTMGDFPSIDSSNGEHMFTYSLRAINADAHLGYYYYVLIPARDNGHDGMVTDTPQVFGGASMNFTSIVIPNEPKPVTVFMDREIKFPSDCFLAMEFGYKSKGDKQQTPLRKIYHIYANKTKVREVDSQTFIELSLILKKYKIWTKFYNL